MTGETQDVVSEVNPDSEPNASQETKTYVVYVHQNKENLKVYVGFSGELEKRWRGQQTKALDEDFDGYDQPFYRAIRKYGWDGFTHDVIEEFDNKQDALDAEMLWIAFFRANRNKYGKEYGYNLTDGGEGTFGHPPWNKGTKGLTVGWNKGLSAKDNPIIAETNKKMQEGKIAWMIVNGGGSRKGAKYSDELKQKLSEAHMGIPHPHSKEQDRKISEALKSKGIKPPRQKTELTAQNLIDIQQSNLSIPKICKRYHIGAKRARRILAEVGV